MEDVLKRPVISVIMSVYNEPIEWITQSINSILNQTFNNYEFVIVNDNPARSENVDLLESFAKSDSRIKIIHNQTNLGLPTSLNKAISQAQGKYIARMDADDISLPNRFQLQYDFLEKNIEYGICGTYARKLDENSKVGRIIRLGQTDEKLKARLLFYSPFIHPTIMVRKELIGMLKYNENFKAAQDVELWLRMSKKTKFYNIPSILLYYRIITQSSKRINRIELLNKIHSELSYKRFKLIIQKPINESMLILFTDFTSPNRHIKMSAKEIDVLFEFLLGVVGDSKYLYDVLLQRYVHEQFIYHSYLKMIINPFIHYSFCRYIFSCIRLLCK